MSVKEQALHEISPNRTGAPNESGTPIFALNLSLREEQRATVDILVEAAAIAAVVAGTRRIASGWRSLAAV